MQLPGALFKPKLFYRLYNGLIFIYISGSNIKKFLMFSYISGNENPEKIPYISGNGNPKKLLIFQDMELLSPSSKDKKSSYVFSYFGK